MTRYCGLPLELVCCLPEKILKSLRKLTESGAVSTEEVTEIRLRSEGISGVTCGRLNIPIPGELGTADIAECVKRFCRGSVYANEDTIRRGYIVFDRGIRIGVCGTYASDGRGIREITSVNIRIPHPVRGISDEILKVCLTPGGIKSLLVYSPPGGGKTTVLRDAAARLGGEYKKRVALIDTRGELYIKEMFSGCMCDVLNGYPRGVGMEIATRTLSPEVIICDELGNLDEAREVLEAQNVGVPVIASAHASSVGELMRRPGIRLLHDNDVFQGYMKISRAPLGGCTFEYTSREEAEN